MKKLFNIIIIIGSLYYLFIGILHCNGNEPFVEIPIVNPTPINPPTKIPGVWELVDCSSNDYVNQILDFQPAAGQFINNEKLNNPIEVYCEPLGGTTTAANNASIVSLGGFGGYIVFSFPETIENGPEFDFIVYGNAYWNADNPQNRWIEPGYVEISVDSNDNGEPDDSWYLIPGSHIVDGDSDGNYEEHKESITYHISDTHLPPENKNHYPDSEYYPEMEDSYELNAYLLPEEVCGTVNNPDPNNEQVWGYADINPSLSIGQYTADDPKLVGLDADTRGGDAFDINWAINPDTGTPANLSAVDFIKITNGCNEIEGAMGEVSTEIDGVVKLW